MITNSTTYSFGVDANLTGTSGQLADLPPGVTVTGISTDGINFTPVTTTDETFANSASVTGQYLIFKMNQDGTAQEDVTPDGQTLVNDVEANGTASTPLSDTFYYELSNGDVDAATFTLNDVIFNANGSAYGALAPLLVAPNTETNISGLSVDTALSSTEATDQNNILTLTVSLFDFATQQSDGEFSLNPLQETAGAGGAITTVTTGQVHSVTIIGSVAQINADLAGLNYDAPASSQDNIEIQATDGPATTANFIVGEVETGTPVPVDASYLFEFPVGPFSSNVIDSGFGGTITGISTNGIDFTPVNSTDPSFSSSAEVDGQYTSFSANADGSVQSGLVQPVQQVVDDIQANEDNGATTPLSDTYYFEYSDGATTGFDQVTIALDDVYFTRSAAPFSSPLTIALGTSIDIPGLSVDKALADGQTTDQNEPLTVVLTTDSLTNEGVISGTSIGTLSIDPAAEGAGAGGTITTTIDAGVSTLTITGSISQIDADLQGLRYTDVSPGQDVILATGIDGPAMTGGEEVGLIEVPYPVTQSYAYSYDFPNSNGYSSTLPGLAAGDTLTGISTDDINFIPVTLTNPTYTTSASVTGQYLTFNANADGTGQEIPYPDEQTLINEIAGSGNTPLNDTFYYQYTSSGQSFVAAITWTAIDLAVATSGPEYYNLNANGNLGIGPDTAVNIGGITIDQPLSIGQTSDAGDMQTFTVGLYDFTSGGVDGALSVNPAQEGAGAGGQITPDTVSLGQATGSISAITFIGSISQINADLQGLTYTSSNTPGTDAIYWMEGTDPLAYEGAILGGITSPCYCRGTRILTDHGEVAVENLRIGDRLVTAHGQARELRWIGRRSYAARFAVANPEVLPVRIRAGAIADDVPRRDLYVSPQHALYLDNVLIPAACLVNGSSICRVPGQDAIEYFHLELPTHDVLIAEGAPAESYLDEDNRFMFQNAASYALLYPDAPAPASAYCAPRLECGPAVERARARLAARCGEPAPVSQRVTVESAGRIQLHVPPGVRELHLVSASAVPQGDRRSLGVLVHAVSIDGVSLPLSDARLARGFHPTERHGAAAVRWTNGEAVITLTPGTTERLVHIDIGAVIGTYLAA